MDLLKHCRGRTGIAVLAVLAVSAAVWTGCDRADSHGAPGDVQNAAPDTAASSDTTSVALTGPPRISFAATTHDFGTMYETEQRSTSFAFTNSGGENLVIRDVKTTCGCTAAKPDKREYRPGESGTISVTYDPKGPGRQPKYVTIISNAQPDELTRLTIKADVKPFLIFEPAWLQMGVLPYGREHRATISVTSPDKDFVVESARATHTHATARVIPPAATQSVDPAASGVWTVEVTISPDAPWGGCYFALEVTASGKPYPGADPVTYTSNIRAGGQLFGELRADPDMFRFGVDPGQAVERTIRLSGLGGRPFEVLGVSVADPQLPDAAVRATAVGTDTWELTLTATAPRRPARCFGKVTVQTDVPGEDTIEIGILGVVRAPSPG